MPLGTNGTATSAVENDSPTRYMTYAQELLCIGAAGRCVDRHQHQRQRAERLQRRVVTAKAVGMTVIGLTGERDSRLSTIADATIRAPATVTAEVQACHIRLYHTLCEMIEDEEFGDAPR